MAASAAKIDQDQMKENKFQKKECISICSLLKNVKLSVTVKVQVCPPATS